MTAQRIVLPDLSDSVCSDHTCAIAADPQRICNTAHALHAFPCYSELVGRRSDQDSVGSAYAAAAAAAASQTSLSVEVDLGMTLPSLGIRSSRVLGLAAPSAHAQVRRPSRYPWTRQHGAAAPGHFAGDQGNWQIHRLDHSRNWRTRLLGL